MLVDVEQILSDWLTDQLGPLVQRVLTERPSDLLAKLPTGVVTLIGGGDDQANLTRPRVDVDWYAAGRDAGVQLASRAHALMRYELRNHRTADGHVITAVRTSSTPRRLPYDSRNQIWRYGASYEIWLHQRAFRP